MKIYQIFCSAYSQIPQSKRFGLKVAVTILLLMGILLPAKSVQAQQKTIFLPMVSTAEPNTLQGAGPERLSACTGLISEETALAFEFLNDAGQQRPLMNCNPTLAAVARARAQDMVNRDPRPSDHTNPDGNGPDTLVEQAGYNLPAWYPVTTESNHVESFAWGTSYIAAEVAWDALMNSPSHRTHLRGESEFFRGQSEFGIGYSYGRGRHYWVIISAHPAQ